MRIIDLFIRKDNISESFSQILINIIVATGLFVLFFIYSINRLGINLDFLVLYDFRYRLLQGFITTIQISLASLVLSLVIGFISALGHR